MFEIRFDGESVAVRSLLSSTEELELSFADDFASDDLAEVSSDDSEGVL